MNLDTCKSVLRTALLGGALDSNDAVRSARAELGGMPLALNALASTMGTKLRIRFGTSGSPPFSRTLTRRPIKAMRSVHVEAKEVQHRVQARCG